MLTYAPNIELLYTQHTDYSDRIRAAAADGFTAVEMWMTSTQDLVALSAAAKEVGVRISSVLAEPRFTFTMPGVDLNVFFDGLRESIARAKVLGAPRVVLGSGMGFPGKKRPVQLDELIKVFKVIDNKYLYRKHTLFYRTIIVLLNICNEIMILLVKYI